MKTFNYFWKTGNVESVQATTAPQGFQELGYEKEKAKELAFWNTGEVDDWTFQGGQWKQD